MTEHITTDTGRIGHRRTDDAFGPAVTPPHRPRPLVALGVGESLEAEGEARALGGAELQGETTARTGRPAAETERRTTGRGVAGTEGEQTSQFIVGEGTAR